MRLILPCTVRALNPAGPNRVRAGVAFRTLRGQVHAAVSLTATGSTARLRLAKASQ